MQLDNCTCGAGGEDAVVVRRRHVAHGQRFVAGALDQHLAAGGTAAPGVGVRVPIRMAGHVLRVLAGVLDDAPLLSESVALENVTMHAKCCLHAHLAQGGACISEAGAVHLEHVFQLLFRRQRGAGVVHIHLVAEALELRRSHVRQCCHGGRLCAVSTAIQSCAYITASWCHCTASIHSQQRDMNRELMLQTAFACMLLDTGCTLTRCNA